MSEHIPPDEYLRLVTSLHNQRPKFMAWVEALVQTFADQIAVILEMPTLFDVDIAVGDQLDKTGEWIGLSRYIKTPLEGVYFTFDEDGTLGWDRGIWWTPFDPLEGLTRLPDTLYRTVLKAKIGANHWNGTIPAVYAIYDQLFAGSGSTVIIQDNQDMSMTLAVIGKVPSPAMISILTSGLIPLRPEAVRLNYVMPSVEDHAYFGFDVENDSIRGFDEGAWGTALTTPAP